MSYWNDYVQNIQNGLNNATVTDKEKNIIEIDVALEMWADRVKLLTGQKNGCMFFCGNGASATMAEHMAADWFKAGEIRTLSCAEVGYLTAISNDISYDDVFSYKIERMLSQGDIVVAISASGNSENVVKALKAANEMGLFTVSISGMKEENKIRRLGDLNFYVPLSHYGEVESAHATILHMALDFFMEKYRSGRH